MKAARIHSFGLPDVVVVEDMPTPSPGPNEVLVRVMAAGVAPWDANIREGKSKVSPQPPLTLGSDFAGVVEKVGPGVTGLAPDDEVYGVTNAQFCGAQAEFAVATAGMVARKPQSLNHVEAASAPVIAVTIFIAIGSEWTARKHERSAGKLCPVVELPHSNQRKL